MRRVLAMTVALAVVGAGTAQARRSPTRSEAAAITRAVKTSSLTRGVAPGHYNVTQIRVSTVNSSYAAGEVVPTPAYRGRVQQASVLLHRRNHRWVLIDIGGAIGCPHAPKNVLRDLGAHCD